MSSVAMHKGKHSSTHMCLFVRIQYRTRPGMNSRVFMINLRTINIVIACVYVIVYCVRKHTCVKWCAVVAYVVQII